MKLYKPYTEKFETRNIVKKSSQLFDTYFQCEFVYTTIHYNIFGQPRKKVNSIIDQLTFIDYDAAKEYIENVVKPSEHFSYYNMQIVFPKECETNNFFKVHKYKCMYNLTKRHYSVVTLSSLGLIIDSCKYESKTLKNIVKNTISHVKVSSAIVYAGQNTSLGFQEIKPLEEKRNDLIDAEIERSKQYIAFLEELKK